MRSEGASPVRMPVRDLIEARPRLYQFASHLRKEVYSVAAMRWPTLWLFARLPVGLADNLVSAKTHLTIEGYAASANSFATHAFMDSQPDEVVVAHHTHSPAQVARAVKLGVPVLLLVRKPGDAVASAVARFHQHCRQPTKCAALELRSYRRFYAGVDRFAGSVLVARFDEVVADFGRIIERLNELYGTSFVRFEHTPERVAAVFEHFLFAKPEEAREGVKADIQRLIDTDLRSKYVATEGMYRALSSHASA